MKKEVVLRVEESAYEKLLVALSLCPAVEVVSEVGESDPLTGADQCSAAANAVAQCFRDELLDPLQPNQLFLLLLAMRARRKWMGREIPAFVDMLVGCFAELEQYYGKTKEQLAASIYYLHNKSVHYFYDYVNDQASMQLFIDELYPKKKNGERSKAGENAQILAEKLFLRF